MPPTSISPPLREIAVILLLMAGAAVAAALAYGYGLGSVSQPGPGGFPFILSLGVAASCPVALVGPLAEWRRGNGAAIPGGDEMPDADGAPQGDGEAPVDLPRVLAFIGLMILWTALMNMVGFAIASVLGVTAMVLLNGHRRPVRAVIFACVLTGACYLLFNGLLGLRL